MNETEAEVEQHNRRELWRDVANHLRVAYESIEQAQDTLEDLKLTHFSDQLDEHADAIRRAANEALEQTEK